MAQGQPSDNTENRLKPETAAQLLWDQYKFRQEHYWRSLHRYAFAIITLCVVPFVAKDVVQPLGISIVALPILALLLTGATCWLLWAEYIRLREVMKSFDKLLGDFGPKKEPKNDLRWASIGFVTSLVYGVGFTVVSVASIGFVCYIALIWNGS